MAAQSFGTAHLYGITGTITNASVQSFKQKNETQNNGETVDEFGNEIERRYDDSHWEGTIELKMTATYAIPAVASILVYETYSYEVTGIDRAEVAKGFRMLTLSIKRSQYIDSSTSTSITTSPTPG